MNNKYLRDEYKARINRALDYIDNNLDKPLLLKDIASVANFSAYHFHRIFGAMMGEPLNAFIQRVRIEKSAYFLLSNPKKSITEIALDCGFSSSATFARAFKEHFNVTASQWRDGAYKTNSKISKAKSNAGNPIDNLGKSISNTGEAFEGEDSYFSNVIIDYVQILKWKVAMKNSNLKADVRIEELKPTTVAYVRHVGPYQGDSALFGRLIGQLCQWAGPRGLLNTPEAKIMSVYHDNPEITDPEKLRMSICITVAEDTEVDGEIGKMVIDGGKYALARFELDVNEYANAWQAVFGGWLPNSGYQPDDKVCFEIYHNNPEEHPENKCIVDICIPVKPL